MKLDKKNRGGFTLIEVVIATMLSVLVVAGTMTLMEVYTKLYHGILTQSALDTRGRATLRQLQIDVRRSIGVAVQNQGTNATGVPGSRLETTFLDGTVASFELVNEDLIYDADAGSTSNATQTLMTGLHPNSFFLLDAPTTFLKVTVNLAIVDPFSMDGLQLFTINTIIVNRVPSSL